MSTSSDLETRIANLRARAEKERDAGRYIDAAGTDYTADGLTEALARRNACAPDDQEA